MEGSGCQRCTFLFFFFFFQDAGIEQVRGGEATLGSYHPWMSVSSLDFHLVLSVMTHASLIHQAGTFLEVITSIDKLYVFFSPLA